MCFTRVPLSLLPLHPQSRPTKNAKNVPLSWCIVSTRMVDASPYATIRSGQCSVIARFETRGEGDFSCAGEPGSRKNDVPSGGSRSFLLEPGPRTTSSSFSGARHASLEGKKERERKGLLKGRQNEKFPFFLLDSSSSRSCTS